MATNECLYLFFMLLPFQVFRKPFEDITELFFYLSRYTFREEPFSCFSIEPFTYIILWNPSQILTYRIKKNNNEYIYINKKGSSNELKPTYTVYIYFDLHMFSCLKNIPYWLFFINELKEADTLDSVIDLVTRKNEVL